jgi:hypothetical protein
MRYKSPTESWLPRDQAPPFDRSRYPSPLLVRASDVWRRLSEDERSTVIAATQVTTDLARLGAPPEILGMAARVIEDEIRHVEVCSRVLDSLGPWPSLAPPPETPRPSPRTGGSVEARAARTLIARFAVGEPLWAACFAAARAIAREPIIAWAYTELLRDEARHGNFGARAGAWVLRAWSPARRQMLWRDCLAEIESFERRLGIISAPKTATTTATAPARPRRDTAAEALGLISAEAAYGTVNVTLPRSVLPHLTGLGIVPPPADLPAVLQ